MWAAIASSDSNIGCVPQTFIEWVKRVRVDAGLLDGVADAETQLFKELTHKNKGLRRLNEIFKLASSFLPKWNRAVDLSTEMLQRLRCDTPVASQFARSCRVFCHVTGVTRRPAAQPEFTLRARVKADDTLKKETQRGPDKLMCRFTASTRCAGKRGASALR